MNDGINDFAEGDAEAAALEGVTDDPNAPKRLTPLPHWLRFKTHGGTDYYYDPTNEMIHYLAGP
eukprot:2171271-Prymnesium_polylepis.1